MPDQARPISTVRVGAWWQKGHARMRTESTFGSRIVFHFFQRKSNGTVSNWRHLVTSLRIGHISWLSLVCLLLYNLWECTRSHSDHHHYSFSLRSRVDAENRPIPRHLAARSTQRWFQVSSLQNNINASIFNFYLLKLEISSFILCVFIYLFIFALIISLNVD